jgi:hypothetical protein
MAAPIITPIPTPPIRSDAPADFAAKADAFAAALPQFVTEANTSAAFVDQRAIDADASAQAAAASEAAVEADRAEVEANTATVASNTATVVARADEVAANTLQVAADADQVAADRVAVDAALASVADGPVTSVNGKTGVVDLTAAELGVPLVRAPENTYPASGETDISGTPTLAGSAYQSLYGIVQAGAQFQISLSSTFADALHDSGTLGAVTSYVVPAGVHVVSTSYWYRLRYLNADGTWSDWSAPTQYTTAAAFNSYIPTPTPTPANYGDPFEGGFYAGLFWNELTQATGTKTLATGTQNFTVPDMTGAPIVYEGQLLEVRSRANPANKFIGTVTGATGATLTLNVTSIGGSGTFSDWSVMSRYRSIEAPKASGEIASIALKNANTALPVACQTLTEGWKATLAMVAAGDATAYPAAHAVRALVINGKDDWYIPARDQRELSWRNLKPVTDNNYVTADRGVSAFSYANNGSAGDTSASHGVNNNSAPTGAAYTTTNPAQTAATAFRSGGAEAFEFGSAYYWSCSEYNATFAWAQHWGSSNPGRQLNNAKSDTSRVRAVRRSII